MGHFHPGAAGVLIQFIFMRIKTWASFVNYSASHFKRLFHLPPSSRGHYIEQTLMKDLTIVLHQLSQPGLKPVASGFQDRSTAHRATAALSSYLE